MKIFYADSYIYGINPINIKLEFGDNIYYLGDIVDVKNAHSSKIFEAQELVAKIEKKAGNHYISGNLELTFHNIEHTTKDGIYMTHGDIFAYGFDKAMEKRTESPGKGKIIRFFKGLVNHKRKEGVGHCVGNTKFKEKCLAKALENSCHTVIVGHQHTSRLQVENYKGIVIYALPRGKTIIQEL